MPNITFFINSTELKNFLWEEVEKMAGRDEIRAKMHEQSEKNLNSFYLGIIASGMFKVGKLFKLWWLKCFYGEKLNFWELLDVNLKLQRIK